MPVGEAPLSLGPNGPSTRGVSPCIFVWALLAFGFGGLVFGIGVLWFSLTHLRVFDVSSLGFGAGMVGLKEGLTDWETCPLLPDFGAVATCSLYL